MCGWHDVTTTHPSTVTDVMFVWDIVIPSQAQVHLDPHACGGPLAQCVPSASLASWVSHLVLCPFLGLPEPGLRQGGPRDLLLLDHRHLGPLHPHGTRVLDPAHRGLPVSAGELPSIIVVAPCARTVPPHPPPASGSSPAVAAERLPRAGARTRYAVNTHGSHAVLGAVRVAGLGIVRPSRPGEGADLWQQAACLHPAHVRRARLRRRGCAAQHSIAHHITAQHSTAQHTHTNKHTGQIA